MKTIEFDHAKIRWRVKKLVLFFMISLILSGLTAFPLESELYFATSWLDSAHPHSSLARWIEVVYAGVHETNQRFPFIAYGTDWLAFAHVILAVLFIGPLQEPVKNIWVIEFGLVACVAVLPMALLGGAMRGIPLFWRLIDCLFGIGGGLILWRCYCDVKQLTKLNPRT